MKLRGLDSKKIIDTIDVLEKRVSERFPESGLRNVIKDFLESSKHIEEHVRWIASPNIPLRLFSYLIISIGLGGLIYSITYVDLHIENTTLANIVTISEAIFNDIVLLGAAVFFLVTMETRIKRKRALRALNELRAFLHVIDMHQLTKDPKVHTMTLKPTTHSPERSMSDAELQRYLDYCSECTSLVAKVAALYSQHFPDEVVVRSVNEIESLSTGLSRKIWQKIVILEG